MCQYKKNFHKHYYVEYCHQSFGGTAFRYFAFNSKRERDLWLEIHETTGVEQVARAISRRDMESYIGAFRLMSANRWLEEYDEIVDGVTCEVMPEKKAARLGLDPFTNSRNM